jgi:hypothetical protein
MNKIFIPFLRDIYFISYLLMIIKIILLNIKYKFRFAYFFKIFYLQIKINKFISKIKQSNKAIYFE